MRNAVLSGSSGLYERKPILKGGIVGIVFCHMVHHLQMIWFFYSGPKNATPASMSLIRADIFSDFSSVQRKLLF